MVLVFLVFFVFAILNHLAKTEQLDCLEHTISSDRRPVYFDVNQVYAVRVCVTMKWRVQRCKQALSSRIILSLQIKGGEVTIPSDSFEPADVKGRFCYIFDPCEISKALNLAREKIPTISAVAKVYAFDKGPDPASASLDIQIADTYYATGTKGDTREVDHEILSVICRFPDCTVQSEGYKADNKYYFKSATDGISPECIEKDIKTEATTFSVTTFLCDPKCSRKYSTLESPIDAPPGPGPLPGLPPPTTGDTGTKDTVPPEKKPDTKAPATKARKAPAAAATTKKSNAVLHLGIRTIFTVAVLALLA